jgi:hypothetical protein
MKSSNKKRDNWTNNVSKFIGSNLFFKVVTLLFVLQAGWLATSAAYPMLYDEYYHPAVIDQYSDQYSPIISTQSDEITSSYGDLTRSPSYLYHYLMSFPYRLVTAFTDSFYVSIVGLRLLNVLLVAGGLILYRKLLVEAGFSRSLIHSVLLILTLIPLFTHVAAHINYDNMIFLMTPLFLLFGLRLLREHKISYMNISLFISTGLLSSLVKQAFLPIASAAIIYVSIVLVVRLRHEVITSVRKSLKRTDTLRFALLTLLLVMSIGLFAERNVGNLLTYKSLKASCEKVQPAELCNQHPVISRNNDAKQQQQSQPKELLNIAEYTKTEWLPAIVDRSVSVYANTGSNDELGLSVKANVKGLAVPVLKTAFSTLILISVIVALLRIKTIIKLPNFWYFFTVCALYFLVLWYFTNYKIYLRTGEAFSVQPRYFIALLPLIMIYLGQGVSEVLRYRSAKIAALAIAMILLSQGGGIATYIIRSDNSWYWQRDSIISINNSIKNFIQPLIKE